VSVAANLTVWPAGAQLPASFLTQKWDAILDNLKPSCLTRAEGKCDAFVVDLTGDGKPDILLLETPRGARGTLYIEDADGSWKAAAHLGYRLSVCQPLLEKLRQGAYSVVEPRFKDLNVGGQRVELEPEFVEENLCDKFK
jgi:hypothetical protein